MDEIEAGHRSHLFTVRIWSEDLGDGRADWRGKVQHALSGETRYFRDCPSVVAFLLALVPPAYGSERGQINGDVI